MSIYTKENVSDLLFSIIDAIIIVDAEKDSYNTIKKQGIFEKLVEDEGSYKSLVEKLWFHLNNNPKKITDDYHVFIPMIGQFKGKYVDRINLSIEEKIHQVQISIYPIDESCKKYIFILDELDNSEYLRDFQTARKLDTMQNTFLFSMYVDLIKDISYSINVTELSDNPQNYDVKYTEWRMMIVNMIWPDDQKLFLERTDPDWLKKNLEPGRATSFDCQMKNLEGVFIWVKLIFSRAATTNDEDFRFVFMVQNIHENHMKLFDTLKRYEELASKDPLTDIYNHGRIETEISNSIEGFNSDGKPVSFMMLDIDFFKKVNDEFGHSVGDFVLKAFVKVVNDFITPYKFAIGRWGGEEFVCVCYGMDLEHLKPIAEGLRKAVEDAEFEKGIKITCSIGLTQVTKDDTAQIIFDRVDSAMYEAKTSGRNRIIQR
ncbi:GGDEF domain-containing protein [Treponema bryantii]|uniref:GGDEF domain-containing protein n=1 Tax=Treponema bryantii TaxID=163 RepID=UPI0003B51EA8|nr:GGDEF domain-containing protein [Treponema bryantii]